MAAELDEPVSVGQLIVSVVLTGPEAPYGEDVSSLVEEFFENVIYDIGTYPIGWSQFSNKEYLPILSRKLSEFLEYEAKVVAMERNENFSIFATKLWFAVRIIGRPLNIIDLALAVPL